MKLRKVDPLLFMSREEAIAALQRISFTRAEAVKVLTSQDSIEGMLITLNVQARVKGGKA